MALRRVAIGVFAVAALIATAVAALGAGVGERSDQSGARDLGRLSSNGEPQDCRRQRARFEASLWRTACWRPYAATSPFNRRMPTRPRLAPNSADVVERMTSWGPPQNLLIAHADTPADYFHPLYWAHANDPAFKVRCLLYRPCRLEGKRVRIPDRARPAAGGDGHLAVIDQRSGWEYDFWQVRSKPAGGGTLVVSHAGRTRIDGSGLGARATAASFGLAAGVIRAEELRAGRIDHALFAQIKCTSGRSVYPAQRRATGDACERFGMSNAAAPPLGARFVLDLSDAEIAQLDVPEWRKTILRALARYGMIVGDTNGGNGAWGLQIESGSTYTSFGRPDPWQAIADELDAPRHREARVLVLDGGVAWARHLRQVHPCVSRGRC